MQTGYFLALYDNHMICHMSHYSAGSLVPFTLRLLHATLPRHTGDAQLALDRLCRLQQVCEQVSTYIMCNAVNLPDSWVSFPQHRHLFQMKEVKV